MTLPKLTVEFRQDNGGALVAILKAETVHGTNRFYGCSSSAIGAVKRAIESIETEKRRCRRGRRSNSYKVASALR